ncbi:7214_t:CDS:2, partial [Dentiscutata heterogama]
LIEEGVFLYPIQIGWQTLFEQNNKHFYMHITEGHEHNEIKPGYRCQTGSNYRWDENKLLELSLESIQFHPFAFKVKKYLVYVTSLGIRNNINMMGAGIGFMSSFFGEFKKKYALFVQTIEKDNCQVAIYPLENVPILFLEKTPNDVWKNVDLYKKFCGTQLFGLEHSLTQKII